MPWSFEVFGEKFREDELTLDQYVQLEEDLDVSWQQIHPLRSAKQARQIAARMYADRHQVDADVALGKIGEAGAVQFIEDLVLAVPDNVEESPDPPPADKS